MRSLSCAAVRHVLMPDFTDGTNSPLSRMAHAADTRLPPGGRVGCEWRFVGRRRSAGVAIGEHPPKE